MADEAVVRIVIDGGASASPPTQPAPVGAGVTAAQAYAGGGQPAWIGAQPQQASSGIPAWVNMPPPLPSQPPPLPTQPPPLPVQSPSPAQPPPLPTQPPPLPSAPPPLPDPTTAQEIARRRVEREEKQAVVDAEYAKLKPPAPEPPFDPVEVARKRIEREEKQALVDEAYRELKPPEKTEESPFDPLEIAIARMDREKRQALVDEEYQKLYEQAHQGPPLPPPSFDPVEVAKKRVEREEQQAKVDEEYARLKPPPPKQPFNAELLAIKRIEREQEQAAIDQKYAELRPFFIYDPPFDPVEVAKKRVEREEQQAKVDEEYAKLKPPPPEPKFDPAEAARKRLEREIQQQEIEEEYRKIAPDIIPEMILFDPEEEARKRHEQEQLQYEIELRQAEVDEAYKRMYGVEELVEPEEVKPDKPADMRHQLKTHKAVRDAMGGVGAAAGIPGGPGNDPVGQISNFGSAIAKTAGMIPGLGTAAIVAGESLKIFSSVVQGINQTADRYGEYSPEIAQAQAIAEVRQVMGDLRRAQEIGGEMARYLIAQSDLQQKFEDMKVKMLSKILPIVTRMVELLETVMPSGEGISSVLSLMLLPLETLAAVAKIFAEKKDERVIEDPTTMLNDPRFTNEWVPNQ